MARLPAASLPERLARLRRGWAVAALGAAAAFLWASPSLRGAIGAGAALAAGDLFRRLQASLARRKARRALGRPVDAELSRGQAQLLSGDLLGAERTFGTLAAIDPSDAEAHLYWGLALREQGNAPAARRIFRRAMRLDLDCRWTLEVFRLLSPA